MPLDIFHSLIKYYSENYSVILPDQISQKTDKPKLIITFDDGYKDFINIALPILVHYNIPAIMNIVVQPLLTGKPFWTQKLSYVINKKLELKENLDIEIGGQHKKFTLTPENAEKITLEIYRLLKDSATETRSIIISDLMEEAGIGPVNLLMDVNDLKLCMANNILIGSHSYSHEILSEKTSDVILEKEVKESKIELEKIIGQAITIFASPNGELNQKILNLAKEVGYKYFLTTEENIYLPNSDSSINVVPRILLYDKTVNENILRTRLFHANSKALFKMKNK
ncbi:MAG: polysaccharide deacetylase family protein [Bacteroidetes bacterium]|nr:polysaccharide deacetylase family protein [Bacteroidota bacterium]